MSESCCAVPEAPTNTKLEYAKFVALILSITLAAYVTHILVDSVEWMQQFMGWFLIAFAGFKLVGYNAFVSGFPTYDLLGGRSKLYTKAFPFIELMLGILLLSDFLTPLALTLVLGLMATTAVSIGLFLSSGKKATCACLGGIIDLPLSVISLFEAVLMALMALLLLV